MEGEKNVEAIAFAAEENPGGLTSVELLENGADASAQDAGVLSQDDQILSYLGESPIYLQIHLREPLSHLPESPIHLREPLIEHFPSSRNRSPNFASHCLRMAENSALHA